jgi:hypothetical protein
MTNTAEAQIAITPEQVADLSPADVEVAKTAFKQAGFSEADVEAKFNITAGADAGPRIIDNNLTTDQARQMLGTLLKHAQSSDDRDRVLDMADKYGIKLTDANGQVINKSSASGLPEFDYRFSYTSLNQEELGHMAEDLPTLDGAFKDGFTRMEIPPPLAQRAIEAFVKSSENYRNDEDAEKLADKIGKERAMLQGMSNGAELMRLSKLATDYMQHNAPQLHEWLSSNFAFHTLQSQIMLSQLGIEIERRNSRRK